MIRRRVRGQWTGVAGTGASSGAARSFTLQRSQRAHLRVSSRRISVLPLLSQ
jgi:hypothetical protein